MPPAPAAFRDRLVGLDPATLTAFVAAVYDARGWETEHVGDDLLVRPAGESKPVRLAVRHPTDPTDDPTADRVVVPTLAAEGGAGVPVIDAADLLEMVWYAVDDADRTRLFRTFLDCDPADLDAADSTATESGAHAAVPDIDDATDAVDPGADDSAGATGGVATDAAAAGVDDAEATNDAHTGVDAEVDATGAEIGRYPRRRFLVIGLVVLLVAGGAVAGPMLGSTDGGIGTGDDADAPTAATPSDPAAADLPADPTGAGVDVAADDLPPGVDADGIADAATLAAAHESALAGRSYRLSIVGREFVGGRPTAVARERTVVESPTRYRSDVQVIGTFRQHPRAIGDSSVYADGTVRYVRLTNATDADGTIRFTEHGSDAGTAGGPGWRRVALDSTVDPVANRTAVHLRRALDVDNAIIVGSFERDGLTYVWIDLQRRPPGGTDAIDSILVDERGLVHEVRHEYAYLPAEASTVRTVVTVRITPANVTATPPPWL